jgi:hypothetical protein
LGGSLFGSLDTAVISGAEQDIQRLWNLDQWQHGISCGHGTIPNSGLVPHSVVFLADKAEKNLPCSGLASCFSYLLSVLPLVNDVYSFMLFRFLGGLVCASSVVAPVYIFEIATPNTGAAW